MAASRIIIHMCLVSLLALVTPVGVFECTEGRPQCTEAPAGDEGYFVPASGNCDPSDPCIEPRLLVIRDHRPFVRCQFVPVDAGLELDGPLLGILACDE